MTRHLYVGHPIDQAGRNVQLGARLDELETLLAGSDWISFWPGRAFVGGRGATPDRYVAQVDAVGLGRADAMVIVWPAGMPSVGCGMEIERALHNDIPCVVVTDAKSWMLQHPRIRVVDTVQEAWGALNEAVREGDRERRIRQARRMRIEGPGPVPTRAHDDDAGFDLYYHWDIRELDGGAIKVEPGEVVDIPAGVAVELPDGMWSMIIGRSSSFRNRGLLVNTAVIDPGYRGRLFAIVRNVSNETQIIQPGDRIAQLIPFHSASWGMETGRVEKLSESARGDRGFGSSGK